jgi:hypothetical protein
MIIGFLLVSIGLLLPLSSTTVPYKGVRCGNAYVAATRADAPPAEGIFDNRADVVSYCRGWGRERLTIAAAVGVIGVLGGLVGWVLFARPRGQLPPGWSNLRRPQ